MTVKAVANTVLARREALRRKYDAAMKKLDGVELCCARAEQLGIEWSNSAADRDFRLYVSDDAWWVSLEIILPRGALFAEAAEMFEKAERELSGAFGPNCSAVVEELKDTTISADRAKRGSCIKVTVPGDFIGYHVSVNVAVPVAPGDPCRIVKVGEKPASDYLPLYRSGPTPIYRSTCPGDPLEAKA